MKRENQNHKSEGSKCQPGVRRSTVIFGAVAVGLSFVMVVRAVLPPLVARYLPTLTSAIKWGDIKGMRKAISRGADVNAIDWRSGHTPLTLATQYGRHSRELVLETPDLRHERIGEMLELLIENGADVNATDRFGHTVLWLATNKPYFKHPASKSAVDEHRRAVALLIENKADLNIKCGEGYTPLHNAVCSDIESRNLPVVELLVENGADVNARNGYRHTPLELAVESGQEKIAEYLREHGAKE